MDLLICTDRGHLSLNATAQGFYGYSIIYFFVSDRPDAFIAIEQGGLSFAKKASLASACAFLAASGITDEEMRTALLGQGCEPTGGNLASTFAMNYGAIRNAVLESSWFAELEDFAGQITSENVYTAHYFLK